ncbi:MAG: hypothetical protein MJZ29_09955 [Bacteroidaceae bacterium]|nr:hypothetical protein [Bacteroidaceae bacterium]
MLFLLAVLTGSSASWAQTTITTFSMPTDNPTPAFGDAYILGDNGGVTYYAQGLKDGSGNHVYRVVNGQTFRKLQDNDIEKAHIKLQFAPGTIKAGDVLSISCVQVWGTSEEVGYEMGESGTNVSGNFEGSPITLSHTITANEIKVDGSNEYIRIGRMDWKQSAYGTITVTRSNTHPANITCVNNRLDLSKIVAGAGASYNANSHQGSITADWARITVTFSEPVDLHELNTLTLAGTNVEKTASAGAFNGVSFIYNGGNVTEYNYPFTIKDENREQLRSVTAIELFGDNGTHKGNFTLNSITLNFGGEHAKKPTPTFKDVTATNMVVVEGYDLKLSLNESGAIWREYTDGTFADQKYDKIAEDAWGNSVTTIPSSKLSVGQTYYFAGEIVPTQCEYGQWHGSDKAKVTVKVIKDINLSDVLSGMNPIYQPVFNQTFDGIAKEYIPFANITVPTSDTPANERTIADELKVSGTPATLNKSFTDENGKRFANIVTSGKDIEMTANKGKNAYILGSNYAWNDIKGMAISHGGAAGMPQYIEGRGEFPTNGVVALKVQGTFDVTALLQNDLSDGARRMIKVYYTNDQLDGRLKELKSWDFNYTRNETNANGLNALVVNVRLAQLGQNGTCTLFFTYESNVADDNVWVKGFVIKRPDLKVTIGRTDKYGYQDDGVTLKAGMHENVRVSPFGFDKPYQWNFGKSSFTNTKESDIEKKKVNQYDGRTYICAVDGLNNELIMDHLLVFSDGKGEDKVTFDGRPSNGQHTGFEWDESDHNEHIEFCHPTKYSGLHTTGAEQTGFDADRRSFTPILSNGLKVNVTGSGWFTIACSAPNGAVNMKVISSTNGGSTYMNLLREFKVEPVGDNPETNWQIYKVYLKAHVEKNGTKGFWDGETDSRITITDPEQTQMSLYVVFDAIEGVTYKDGETDADAQLNIHYLQWVNEMPADYVFQREEDPALLNSLQSIVSNGTEEAPGLYWQAGNDDMWEEGVASIPTKDTSLATYSSSFNSGAQEARLTGPDSGWGSVSKELDCQWNVAAAANSVAHTEVAYEEKGTAYTNDAENVYSLETANSTAAADSHKNLEFAIPISGSFFRFMPMKNQFISAFIVPQAGKNASIYVLDETGKPIPFCDGADTNGDNKNKITQEARERGWIHAVAGMTNNYANDCIGTDGTTALRIDFAALAGKEYFIVSNGGRISLARLQATGNAWRADVETTTLASLTDNADNSSAISTAMSGTGRYVESVTLNRKLVEGKWVALVLPFSMNEKKFEEVFGEGARCIHFTDYKDKTVHLTHHFYNMIVAGRPVFVKPTKTVDALTITDVTLQASVPVNTTTPSGMVFEGSYNNTTMSQYDFYLNNNNEIRYLNTASAAYPGLRSIIRTNGKYSPAATNDAPVAMFLNYDDSDMDGATGIESVIAEEFGQNAILVTKSTKVYDLNGRVVANGADMMNNLPSGVYIVNGKKYVK